MTCLKGAETRSRRKNILVNQTAEPITTQDTIVGEGGRSLRTPNALAAAASDPIHGEDDADCSGPRSRRRCVRDAGRSESAASRDTPSEPSVRTRSATPFACGARNGVRTISIFSVRNTSSKLVGELLISVPNQEPDGFRAIGKCPRQLPGLLRDPYAVGVGVQPATCTRRLPSSMKKST